MPCSPRSRRPSPTRARASCGCAQGQAVAGAVGRVHPDLVVLDLQIGNMGGIATCLHLRHEAGAGPPARGAGADAPRPPGRRVPRPPLRRRRLARQAARRLPLRTSRHRDPRRRAGSEPDRRAGTLVERASTRPASRASDPGCGWFGQGRPLLSTVHHGWWLSLAERCVRDAEVGSSNLPHPTNGLLEGPSQGAWPCLSIPAALRGMGQDWGSGPLRSCGRIRCDGTGDPGGDLRRVGPARGRLPPSPRRAGSRGRRRRGLPPGGEGPSPVP